MEPALADQTLNPKRRVRAAGAGILLLALAACGGGRPPRVEGRWRVGLGACGMSVDPAGSLLAVVCRRSDDVWILDAHDGSVRGRFDTRPRPGAVAFGPDGLFFVAEGGGGMAVVASGSLRVRWDAQAPWVVSGFTFDPGWDRLFCAEAGVPALAVVRPSDLHLENSIAVGGEVEGMAVRGADAWLATRRADALVKLSLTRMSVVGVALAGPDVGGLALDIPRDLAYLPCRGRPGPVQALPLPSPGEGQGWLSSDSGGGDGSESASATASAPLLGAEDAAESTAVPVSSSASEGRWDGSGVAVVRLKDVRRVDFVAVPGGPMAAELAPSGRELAVACEDGKLRLLDLGRRVVDAVLDLGGEPGAMVAGPGRGSLLVALRRVKVVVVVDPGSAWN